MNSVDSTAFPTNFDMAYFTDNLKPLMDPFQINFAEIEFGRGIDSYMHRIKFAGLDNRGRVLDAGGGIGNWAISLALINQHVDVIDIASERLFVGRAMAQKLGVDNISFNNMSIENLKFPNASFDSIICYSVIMFTDIKTSLAEFHRVLKPGGRLFLQVDLWRWYFGQSMPKTGKLKYLLRLFTKKVVFGRPQLLTSSAILASVKRAGFTVVSHGQDGTSSFDADSKNVSAEPFYPLKPVGKEELIEICAVRSQKENFGK